MQPLPKRESQTDNRNQTQLLEQLDHLTTVAASQYADIATAEAKHAFQVLFQDKVERLMHERAKQTYQELLTETQNFIQQLAQQSAQRTLALEERTINQAPTFEAQGLEFTTFDKALEAQRQQRSSMAQLVGQSAQEQEIIAAGSLGLSAADIAQDILGDTSPDAITSVEQVLQSARG